MLLGDWTRSAGRGLSHSSLTWLYRVARGTYSLNVFLLLVVVEEPANIQTAKDYLEKNVNPTLIRGLTALCKVRTGN